MLYVRADAPSKGLFIELDLQNTKILINCSYNPYKSEIKKHLTVLRNSLDLHSSKYERILILCDFIVEVEEAIMKSFCENYNLKSVIKQPTCYKNPSKRTCADLMLTNVPRMFQSTCVLETGPSDFHLLTVTVMRKFFKKMRLRAINYRSYRNFSNETFNVSPINNLSNEVSFDNDDGLQKFCKMTMDTLNSFASIKKKYARGNQMLFMTKTFLRK